MKKFGQRLLIEFEFWKFNETCEIKYKLNLNFKSFEFTKFKFKWVFKLSPPNHFALRRDRFLSALQTLVLLGRFGPNLKESCEGWWWKSDRNLGAIGSLGSAILSSWNLGILKANLWPVHTSFKLLNFLASINCWAAAEDFSVVIEENKNELKANFAVSEVFPFCW